MILVTSGNGKTARHILKALRARGSQVRAFCRRAPVDALPDVNYVLGDLRDPAAVARAVAGTEAVIHIGPAFHPNETAIGTSVIDAATHAGVAKLVYLSVIHPQIDALMNHRAKRAVEAHLVHSRADWTVLQPQHYMQNVDVQRVVAERHCALPYSPERTLAFVDLADVAEVAAKVATEPGHRWATYELSSNEHLNTRDLARIISEVAGINDIGIGRLDADEIVKMYAAHQSAESFDAAGADGLRRLFAYYDQFGITGNANVLTWLLGRAPTTFADYCRRQLTLPK